MIARRKMTLLVKCDRCKTKMVLAHGFNSFNLTPELVGERFGCLGWLVNGKRALCPECSGLPALTCRQVLADFMNYMKVMNLKVIPHPNDVPADWSGSTIFGRNRPKMASVKNK